MVNLKYALLLAIFVFLLVSVSFIFIYTSQSSDDDFQVAPVVDDLGPNGGKVSLTLVDPNATNTTDASNASSPSDVDSNTNS